MKKTRKQFFIILIVLLIISSSNVFADTIKVGIYEGMPLVGVDEEGVPRGFFVDVFNYIADRENWDISYEFDTFANNLIKVENSDIDILLNVAWSKTRAEKYLYNEEIIYSNWGQVYSNTSEEINSFIDLKGKTIGVEKGDIQYVGDFGIKNTLESFAVDVNYREYSDRIEMFKDLEDNKIDGGVVSRVFGEYYETNYDIIPTPIQFNPIKNKIITGEVKNQYILDKTDEYLLEMKSDHNSIYHTALNSFLSSVAKPGISKTTKGYILTMLIALMLSILAVVISRKQLAKKKRESERQDTLLRNLTTDYSKLSFIKTIEKLFDGFVEQLKYIMDMDKVEVVVIIKGGENYILDTEKFIEGSCKEFAGENIDKVKFKYIDKEILDEFILCGEEIKFYDNFILVGFMSSYKLPGIIYIENGNKNVDKKILSVYILGVMLSQRTIITNITKEKEQKKLMIALGELIEKRDKNTSNHVMRVSLATKLLAEECGYSNEELYNIEIASSLHDIGKILVPDSILNKPGKLTAEEFEIIKTHATDNFKIFEDFELNLFSSVHNVVRHHHENWNGTGYPDGLKGKEIPLDARIVSVIDVFDALMHERAYKDAWPIEESLEFIESSKGIKFDPELVDSFMSIKNQIFEIFEEYPEFKNKLKLQ
ncbi:MAG: transporter substrate-binding domain-containing protein [Bacillota bacterium]|nr:transporter substrate-binding domain-containing protein [Bacillota bacterium]